MKRRDTTLLWSTTDGIECRMALYDEHRYQLMLRWREQTIKTTVVSDYACALSTSRQWQQERQPR